MRIESIKMKRLRTAGILLIILTYPVAVSVLHAGENVNTTVGTYIETQINNEAYASDNLVIVPGLKFRIAGASFPMYFQYVFENRDKNHDPSGGSAYTGNELRSKFHIGYPFMPGDFSFKPEYELRVKYYVGQPPSEQAVYENRFHLNTGMDTASMWSFYLNYMPTLIFDICDDRSVGGQVETYTDYYHEAEIGAGLALNQSNSIKVGLYSEVGIDDFIGDSGSNLTDGQYLYKYEFQLRLYYQHTFPSGLVLAPFARIGLIRKYAYYDEPGNDHYLKDYRRSRYGMKISSSVSNALTPFFEGYYQHSNMGDGVQNHRMMWKVGMDYTF